MGQSHQADLAAGGMQLIRPVPIWRGLGRRFVCRLVGTSFLAILCAGLFPVAAEPPQQSAAGAALSTARVLGVRFSSQPNYSRVVVDLETEVRYALGRLSDPERLYVDLQDTRIVPKLDRRRIPVDDTLVRQIRIASNPGSVTRVVMDLKSDAQHTISTLTNPPRLLVELRGPSGADEAMQSSSSRRAAPNRVPRDFPKGVPKPKSGREDASPGDAAVSSPPGNTSTRRAATAQGPNPYGNGEKPGLSYAGAPSPQNVLLIDFNAETNYDDNIRGNNQQRAGDIGFSFGPGISFRRQGKQLTFGLSYQPHFRVYRRTLDRNVFEQGLQLDTGFQVNPRLSVRARGSLFYTTGLFQPPSSEELVPGLGSPSSLNGTVFTPLARRLEHNLRFDGTYLLSRRASLAFFGGLSARDLIGDNSGSENLRNTEKRDVGLFYRYRLSPRNTLGINYFLQDLRSGPNTRALVHSTIFSFARQLSPTVTLDLLGGPEYTRLHDRLDIPFSFFTIEIPLFRTEWHWAVGGNLTKRSKKTVFQVTAQRQVSDSGGLFGPAVSSFAGVTVRRRLPHRWDATWTAGYARTSALVAFPSESSIQSQTAGFGLEHSLTENLSVRLGYNFIRQSSSGASPVLADFDRNFWYVSVFYHFEPIALGR